MARYITDKQRMVLEFIQEYGDSNGYAPSIRDVAGRFECSVKGAYDHVVALEKKGLIERRRGSICVLERKALERAACGCYATMRKVCEELDVAPVQ